MCKRQCYIYWCKVTFTGVKQLFWKKGYNWQPTDNVWLLYRGHVIDLRLDYIWMAFPSPEMTRRARDCEFFSKIIIELMICHLILRCNFRVIRNDCSIRSKIVPYITTSFAKKFSIIKVYNIMVSIKSQNLFFLYTTQLNNWITFHHFIVQLFSGAHWKKLNNLKILFLQTANLDYFFVRIKQ